MQRLVETFTGGLKPLFENRKSGNPSLFLEGIGQTTKPNKNGRIYPRELWEHMFTEDTDYQDRFSRGRIIGGLGHPKDGIFDPMNSCLVLREHYLKGDDVYVRLECVTDTPGGQVIKALANVGVELGVSSRGSGDAEDRGGYLYVLPGFYLEGYDAVIDPSVAHANPSYKTDIRKSLESIDSSPESKYVAQRVMESLNLNNRRSIHQESSTRNLLLGKRRIVTTESKNVTLTQDEVIMLEHYIRSLERKLQVNRFRNKF